MMALKNEVIALVNEICYPSAPDVSDTGMSLLEAGVDSLDLASILMALEEKYELTIDESDLQNLTSIDKMVSFVEKRL